MREAHDAASLGRVIKALRRDKGWTQAQLAEWLRVDRQTVIALEQGGPVNVQTAVRAVVMLGGKLVVAPKGTVVTADATD